MSLKVLSTTLRTAAASPAVAGRALASTSTATYSERQAALGRPVSPHVTIYKMPITAVSSVMNRFTAMGITAGLSAGSALALVGADLPAIIYTCQDVIPGFAPISKFFVAYPISYHMFAAARHAVWDKAPQYINNVEGPLASKAIIAAGVTVGLAASLYTIKTPEAKEE